MTRMNRRGGRSKDGMPPSHRQSTVPADRPDRPAEAPRRVTAPRVRPAPDIALIWGFHAVLAALHSPRRTPLRLLATAAAGARLAEAAAARGLTPVLMEAQDLDGRVPRDAVHQGVVLEARPLDALDITDVDDTGTILVLDQITDPHNVGAILRTAAAFDVTALVVTERHAPEITGVLAKSASGALEHVPIVHVVNLARALDVLADRGYRLIGLDSEGSAPLQEVEPSAALALVLGAEGKGLRRLTRERCDVVARLDMPGPIKSLNVSNACAVALTTLRLRALAETTISARPGRT